MTLPIECLKHYGLRWVGIVRNFRHLFQQGCALHTALYSVQTLAFLSPDRATQQHFNQRRSIESTQGVVLEACFSPKTERLHINMSYDKYIYIYMSCTFWGLDPLIAAIISKGWALPQLTQQEKIRKNRTKETRKKKLIFLYVYTHHAHTCTLAFNSVITC